MTHKKYYDEVAYRSLGASTIRNVDQKKHLQPYFKNLRAALADNTVSNIAIFGKFGAGKTTVIKSFLNQEKHNPDIRPLFLSLATFTREAEIPVEKDKPKEGEWVAIERNLVQQMLYGPSNRDLPDSKYKKIESENSTSHQRILGLLSCLLLSVFLLVDPWHVVSLFNPALLKILKILLTGVFLITAWMGLDILVSHYPRWFGSAKLGWGKSELSIKDNQSAFNEYLDEIIYFFSRKRYNVVVLEDIDRFNNLNIFEHLRELNQILNRSEALRDVYGVSDEQPAIKFLYAVKEDLFDNMRLNAPKKFDDSDGADKKNKKASERVIAEATTKFFDWTMTVLPKVSATNSSDFLMEMFKNPTADFREYLRAVSIYFDDVRVLENTINDFKLHSELQEHSDLDAIKMLTVLLFKNGFPREYQRFVRQEGSVSKMIRTRSLATDTIHRLKAEIAELEGQKRTIISQTQDEIIVRYKALFLELGANKETTMTSSDGKVKLGPLGDIGIQELSAFYNSVRNQKQPVLFEVPVVGYYQRDTIRFAPTKLIEKDENFDSDRYFKNIADESVLTDLDIQIQDFEHTINKISQNTLFDLIDENHINVSDYLTDVDEAKDFLSFSIVNGYLDETVDDYLSYFSGTRISAHDRQIVRRLRSGDAIAFNETIENVTNFVGDLVSSDLNKQSIQLGELIAYVIPQKGIVADNEKLSNAYCAALGGLVGEDSKLFSKRFDWLLDHIDRAYYVPLLVDVMGGLNNDWTKYSGSGIEKFADELIEGLPENLISDSIVTMLSLNNYINENEWQLSSAYIAEHPNRARTLFGNEHTMLNVLDSDTQADLNLIDYLIDHDALTCNELTIPVLFKALGKANQLDYSYQLVEASGDDKVIAWINQWFTCFVDVELKLGYIQNESSASLCQMLIHSGVDKDLAKKILQQYPRANLQLSDVHLSDTATDYETFVVTQMIETGRVAMSWSNVHWLAQFESSAWRQALMLLFVRKSNSLGALEKAADQVDVESLTELVNTTQLQLTNANQSVLKSSGKYLGTNQTGDVLSFFINENLVLISDALIEKITSQSELLTLMVNNSNVDPSQWTDTQEALFNKLDVTSLFKIATRKISGLDSLQKIAIDALVDDKIAQENFDDNYRDALLESFLKVSDYTATQANQIFVDILSSYQSDMLQIRLLNRLIVNNHLDVEYIKVALPSVKDPEIAKITTIQRGQTIHLKNGADRWIFVQLLHQRGLLSKAKVLKDKTISIRI